MINLKQQLEAFNNNGQIMDSEGEIDKCYNFYDWFCEDWELKNKAIELYQKVNQIKNSKKINLETTYVFFKNNFVNALYDDFRICDIKTGKVIYTVMPFGPYMKGDYVANVYGRENDFDEPLVEGKWNDVVNFFNN